MHDLDREDVIVQPFLLVSYTPPPLFSVLCYFVERPGAPLLFLLLFFAFTSRVTRVTVHVKPSQATTTQVCYVIKMCSCVCVSISSATPTGEDVHVPGVVQGILPLLLRHHVLLPLPCLALDSLGHPLG